MAILSSNGKQTCPSCNGDFFRIEIARKLQDLNTKEADYAMSIGGDVATYEENGSSSMQKKIVCDKCGLVLKSYRV